KRPVGVAARRPDGIGVAEDHKLAVAVGPAMEGALRPATLEPTRTALAADGFPARTPDFADAGNIGGVVGAALHGHQFGGEAQNLRGSRAQIRKQVGANSHVLVLYREVTGNSMTRRRL